MEPIQNEDFTKHAMFKYIYRHQYQRRFNPANDADNDRIPYVSKLMAVIKTLNLRIVADMKGIRKSVIEAVMEIESNDLKRIERALNGITESKYDFICRDGKIHYGFLTTRLIISVVDTRRQCFDQYMYWNRVVELVASKKGGSTVCIHTRISKRFVVPYTKS